MDIKEEYFDEETGGLRVGFSYPLVYKQADPLGKGEHPDCDGVIRFLCSPETDSDLDRLAERYKAISQEDVELPIYLAPMEPRIRHKLVWPLRQAKGSFMVGNYIGTIAISGMVAEMVALLLFEIAELTHDGGPLYEALQVKLFGRTFERLNQERRIDVLLGYGIITVEIAQHFTVVRGIRNAHLHVLEYDENEVTADARRIYRSTLALVLRVLGSDDPGRPVKMRPELIRFLERNGVPAPLEPPEHIQRQAYPPR